MLTQTFSNQSNQYHPHRLDAYLLHLADMSTTCSVRATEDIYNAQNIVIVAMGAHITPMLAQKIIHFTLLKPLDECVTFAREIDAEQLATDFTEILEQDNVLLAINEYCDFTLLLKNFCQQATESALLRKKLTVMAHAMPDVYQRSLYCVWLCLLIAKEMRLSQADIHSVLLAALAHDIGMLHIDSEILNRKELRTSEEWLHIQHHVFIGAKIISSVPNISPAVALAIYEHHERCDGTGYPLGRVESETGLLGQILGVADSLMAIYFNRFKVQGGSWRDALPIIEMNIQAYFYRAHEILIAIVRRSELPQKNVVQGDDAPEFVASLVQKNEQLKQWFESMRDCLMSIGFRHGDRQLHALQNIMLHLSTSTEGSGIFKAEHQTLLDIAGANTDTSFFRNVESAHLMQQEIVFHLQRLNRMTQLYLDSDECKKDEIKTALLLGLSRAKQYLL